MSIDASIALQAKLPQLDNPLTQYAQFAQAQGLQNQNQLAQYTLSKARREDEDTIAQRNLLTGAGGDLEAGYNALLKGGYLDKAMAIKKAQQEQEKTRSEIGKNNADAGSKNQDVAAKRLETIGQTMGALQGVQGVTPQHVVNGLQHLVDIGAIPADQMPRLTAEIPQDPAALPGWLDAKGKSALKVADQMKYRTPDANAQLTANTSLAVGAGHDRTSLAVGAGNNSTALTVGAGHDAATMSGQGKPQIVQGEQGTVLVNPRTGVGQPVMVDGQPMTPKLKDLPAPIQKAYLENSTALRKIDSAIAAVAGYPQGLGSKNLLGDAIRQRSDPDGVNVRALVADIGSLKIHDRSGAAVTASETPRLAPFIPSATDSPETVDKKLKLFKKEYDAINEDIAATYTREQGYKTPAQKVKAAVDGGEVKNLVDARPVSVKTAADYAKIASGTVYTTPDGSMRKKP